MAKCDICGKQEMSGNNVPHSLHKTKRKFKANVQKVRMTKNGRTRRVYACTKCLRTINKTVSA
ncbi:MAG: 50S ribosomal protein L28 [Anaerolineae bacterium]|nr:50S ribosomal protein L28 [Anaerolineae bacterium]